MKKTLIALAVLGAAAGVAHAQSNVTIYGELDVGYMKTSKDGDKLQMVNGVDNRLGFRGVEDLGGGLKATFQLEQRFDLDTGASQDEGSRGPGELAYKGQANVGLAGAFGAVKLGRVVNPMNEAHRKFDPFNQYGFAFSSEEDTRVANERVRQENALRYDTPNMGGFTASGIVSVKEADGATNNNGYGAVVSYNNGPAALSAGYDRRTNSDESNLWFVGGAYAFGPAKISASYLKGKDRRGASDLDNKQIVLGLDYKLGAGTIKAAYDQITIDTQKDKKVELGYWYGLSKRTTLYGSVAHVQGDFADTEDGSWNGVRLGINHKF